MISVLAHYNAAGGVSFSIRVEGEKADGPCGMTLQYPKFLAFLERLSPDELNGSEYIPAMPIVLPHAG